MIPHLYLLDYRFTTCLLIRNWQFPRLYLIQAKAAMYLASDLNSINRSFRRQKWIQAPELSRRYPKI
ncbi:hypothetical protein [Microcoleus sp. bin38.metabat.b11b12b14.051]|uniref:hypothetical protein n=1 Tax=Microcoleus sp. bin38.metabat.b11b12b14.051 TaxID=2742709 RepID=UPI0025F22EF6|nr:hypothetical protein [Microcoleus sp. bin38.metabat.b11b12b14.051]